MSIGVVFNGSPYTIPVVGEERWGENVTNYLVAIASGCLQKTGGLFTLTAETNFGTDFGLKSIYYKSGVTNISTVGVLRMGNTESIGWRNFTNTGNLLLGVNTSNQLIFNGATISGDISLAPIGSSPNANAATLTGTVLNLQPASASFGGVVTTGTQTFAGNKTFTGNVVVTGTITASNLSGTNTGDITLAAIGSTPNANGATLTGQVLNLEPASTSFGGIVTTGTQQFIGTKVFAYMQSGGTSLTQTRLGVTSNMVCVNSFISSVYYQGQPGGVPTCVGYASGGTEAVPTATPSGLIMMAITARGNDGTGLILATKARIIMSAAELWTPTANGTTMSFWVTPTGSTLLTQAMQVFPNGNVSIGNTSNTIRLSVTGAIGSSSTITGTQLISNVATGTAPLSVTSTTLVPNLYVARAVIADTVTTSANLTGPITSVGNVTSVASQTGTGSTFVMNTSPTIVTPNLGTPTVLVGTNITGTAASLTAGTVTTNANLTGPITSAGNATSVASQTGTGSTFVMNTSPTLITPNLGTPTALVGTNITGTAAGLTAGTVTTNANLTGEVTSIGNATTVTNAAVIAKVLTGYVSGAGTVSATDSILSAIQKLNGNISLISGGVTSVGTFGSTPNTAGASISSNVLTLQPADGTNPGGVSTTTQTFAGAKTFSSALVSTVSTTTAILSTSESNPSSSGFIRLANNGNGIAWRNAANSGNIFLNINASNQLTYNGGAVFNSGGVLLAAAFPALTGDVTTVAGSLTTTLAASIAGTHTFTGQLIGGGTTTNNNAAAGVIGEYVSSVVAPGTSVPALTTLWGDITSISLTAGDWDVSGLAVYSSGGATVTVTNLGISSTSGNSSTGLAKGDNQANALSPTATSDTSLTIPSYRVSISGTTIYYLKANLTYTIGTPTVGARISARRVR